MLFEKLPEKDKRLIEQYISEFGTNPGAYVNCIPTSLEHRLRFWGTEKETLYKTLGNTFIVEKPITYKIPRAKLVDTFSFNEIIRKFRDKYHETLDRYFKPWTTSHSMAELPIANASLIDNSIFLYEKYVIDFGDGQKVTIENGSKPMRALGKIVKIIGLEEEFEEFRLEHSRILNQKDLTGTLCLSIHPMDYLTMSDNASKWSTCMKWDGPGCYRMGTVEMMNSPMVVVAYLKSDNRTYYNWNDKHWRQLFLVSEDLITGIKAYPYECEELSRICVEWLKNLAYENNRWTYCETEPIPMYETFQSVNNGFYHIRPYAGFMYNDFNKSDIPHFGALGSGLPILTTSEEDPYDTEFFFSGEAVCMCCGQRVSSEDLYDESYVYCEECSSNGDEDGCYCDSCGEFIYNDEAYWIDGAPYCSCCIDDVGTQCRLDWDWHYYGDMTKIFLTDEDNIVDTENNACCYVHTYYMNNAAQHFARFCDAIQVPRYDMQNGCYYFNRSDLTPNGLGRFFDIWD